jgi:hypothetical protein
MSASLGALSCDAATQIVHVKVDELFASVEQVLNRKLRGKPVAVGGEKRGIIASASYEARKFGVFTPMPTARARKLCPKLIVLSGDFERYEQFSNWMFGYCYDFTPDVEQTSIDEGYFDLSCVRKSPVEIALTIRKAIGQRLKIMVSEGIGTNKLVSAVASKLNKPAAFNEVPPGGETDFLIRCRTNGCRASGQRRARVSMLPDLRRFATLPERRWKCWNCCSAIRPEASGSSLTGLMSAHLFQRANRRSHSASKKLLRPT